MLTIDSNKNIHITRGDIGLFSVGATEKDGSDYTFRVGDVVRFKVFKCKDCGCVELQKDVIIEAETTTVDIDLNGDDTKIGDIINKPVNYWYEIELNPDTKPQTIIGYDEDGAKIFRLYPEGADKQ